MGTEAMGSWGTWEELLLGGAVLRHGTRGWDVVAAELRARTVCSYTITPEVCKAKYEDLQERYSGCTKATFPYPKAWFEELKKKRVAELKRALEQSEDSIGSLESKLESLKAEKKEKERDGSHEVIHNNSVPGCAEPKHHISLQKLERVESSTKDSSKDGLSAGSFTHEPRPNWSPSDQEMETKTEASHSHSCDQYEKASNVVDKLACSMYGGQIRGSTIKKRRGKRKRKDCSRHYNGKETSVGDSEFLLDSREDVVVSGSKENSTSNSGGVGEQEQQQCRSFRKEGGDVEGLMEILECVLSNKVVSAFRRRLDSQKRGRYKKMIRTHMDLDTIRSRISTNAIKSRMELFRDLLLLTNNALVFYSKTTREYKSALLLRDLVTKKLRQNPQNLKIKTSVPTQQEDDHTHNLPVKTQAHSIAPVKPRSLRPGNRKVVATKVEGSNSASGVSVGATKKSSSPVKLHSDSSPLSVDSLTVKKKKKGIGRPKKVGRGNTAGQAPVMAVKGKRRVRAN